MAVESDDDSTEGDDPSLMDVITQDRFCRLLLLILLSLEVGQDTGLSQFVA